MHLDVAGSILAGEFAGCVCSPNGQIPRSDNQGKTQQGRGLPRGQTRKRGGSPASPPLPSSCHQPHPCQQPTST